jgi:hypothetical protein
MNEFAVACGTRNSILSIFAGGLAAFHAQVSRLLASLCHVDLRGYTTTPC